MANKKITLKRKTASGFDVLHPEVKKANLLTSSGTALNTFAESIIDGDSVTLLSGEGYLVGRYNTNDSSVHQHATAETAASIRSLFEIEQAGHYETIADIDQDAIDLQTVLDGKVPLVNSKIPRQYFPVVNTDSLTFAGVINGGSTSGGATNISAVIDIANDSDWFDSVYDDDDAVVDDLKGHFRIVNTAGYFQNHTGVSADSKTFNFVFRTLDTSTNNFEEVDDYQDDNSDSALYLESGDRVVLTEITKSSSTFTLKFDVINVNYGLAGTGTNQRGSVQLSSATVKSSMSSNADTTKIVDEKVMRDVMKDVVELESFGSGISSGSYHDETEISFKVGDPTTTYPGVVGAFLLNISNGKIFECTASGGETGPWTWTLRTTLSNPGMNKLTLSPATYYDLNGTNFVGKTLTTNASSGTLYKLDPVEDDLVFEV